MISIDYSDKRPIYEQVVEKTENLIVNGVLAEGEQLQSVRSMAIELSINPNTIQRAYAELERRGYIYTVKGKGNFVCSQDKWKDSKEAELINRLEALMNDMKSVGVNREKVIEIVNRYVGE